MPKLVPELQDHWTQNRRTSLAWAEPVFSGCGLSLDIWARLFDFSDGSWFAVLEGAYNDNLSLVSVSAEVLSDLSELKTFILSEEAKEDGNVSKLADSFGFHQLSPAVLKAIGFNKAADVVLSNSVISTLTLHDNFIFVLSRQVQGVELEALRLTLRVHQHYLGLDFSPEQEGRLLERIMSVLQTEGSIQLSSHPSAGEISIEIEQPMKGWFNRLLGRRNKTEERISVVES